MARSISDLIARMEGELPGLRIHLDERYSSKANDHRLELRKALHRQCGEKKILDLSILPKPEKFHASISHCPSLGGFATSSSPVGFDIEETDRVQWNIIDRVLHPNDEKGPWPAAHWTAKEAVYKGLGENQPVIISEIAIGEWCQRGDDIYTFRSDSGSGVVVRFSQWTVAAFIGVPI